MAPSPAEVLEAIERDLAERDPELLAAVSEVDLSLVRWSLSLSPIERLRVCTRNARVLDRLRGAVRHR